MDDLPPIAGSNEPPHRRAPGDCEPDTRATKARRTAGDGITLDAAAPLLAEPQGLVRHLPALQAGGIDAALATIASIEDSATVDARLASWHEYVSRPSSCAEIATSVQAIRTAKQRGRFAVVLHLQGLGSIGQSLDLLYQYRAASVSVAQLTYNHINQLGSGCLEQLDEGLTPLGREVVKAATSMGLVLDISHGGKRTTMEAMELAGGSVVATHANAAALCASPRNLSDEQIRAVAACRGVIGLCAFPAFVATDHPTVDHLANHAAYMAELVGPRHVGLGLDFFEVDKEAYNFYRYDERVYPKPPWRWPARIEGFADTQNLRDALVRRGFSSVEVAGIMGENFLRAFEEAWGS